MRLFKAVLAGFVVSVTLFTGVAGATVKAPVKTYALANSHAKCRVDYVKRTLTKKVTKPSVKTVRYVGCVYVAPKVVTTKAPISIPTGPTASAGVTLGAVDPTATQSPTDPLAITYAYSASASQVVNGLAQQVESLPTGVLELFTALSPGQPTGLVCSMNVGGSESGGNCNVEYQNVGTFQITTTYISGTTSATETDSVTIRPFTTTIATTRQSTGSGSLSAPDNSVCNTGPRVGCELLTAVVTGVSSKLPVGTLVFSIYDNHGNVIGTFTPNAIDQNYCLISWNSAATTTAAVSPDCSGSVSYPFVVTGFQFSGTFAEVGYTTSTSGETS